MVVALGMLAAVGDVGASRDLSTWSVTSASNPSVRQSGPGPVYHGRITNKAVAMLVACWLRPPGRRQGRLVAARLLLADQRVVASTSLPSRPLASWR